MSKSKDLQALMALASKLGVEIDTGETQADEYTPIAHISLGMVIAGTGTQPSEGDILNVPTKNGKTRRRRVVSLLDPDTVIALRGSNSVPSGDDKVTAEWFAIYTNVKRGE